MAIDRKITHAVYQRDGWKCRHCMDRNGLHPHHLIYQSQNGPDELWNIITLCFQCHRAHHDGFLAIDFDATWDNNWPNPPVLTGIGSIKFRRLKGWKPL